MPTLFSRQSSRRRSAAIALTTLIAVAFGAILAAQAQDSSNDRDDDATDAFRDEPVTDPQDPEGPRWHFRSGEIVDLSAEEAEQIYDTLAATMAEGYAVSLQQAAAEYRSWVRYSTAPYRSATHGQRYMNNYANATARAYGAYEAAGVLPVGSVVAKDSFSVSENGTVNSGALFLMEKMQSGFNRVSGDWRYTMILPDGSLYGTTHGDGAERVEFCISCHLAVEHQDHLFFMPETYRREDN
jgi:hypothetical protein